MDRSCALRLAVCNDIGSAAYDSERVAAALVQLLVDTNARRPAFAPLAIMARRYGADPVAALLHGGHSGGSSGGSNGGASSCSFGGAGSVGTCTSGSGGGSAEGFLAECASRLVPSGDAGVFAMRLLTDFRHGHLGRIALDVPPSPLPPPQQPQPLQPRRPAAAAVAEEASGADGEGAAGAGASAGAAAATAPSLRALAHCGTAPPWSSGEGPASAPTSAQAQAQDAPRGGSDGGDLYENAAAQPSTPPRRTKAGGGATAGRSGGGAAAMPDPGQLGSSVFEGW